MITRRSFLGGLLAAPAIIKVATLMPVKAWIEPVRNPLYVGRLGQWEGVRWHAIDDSETIALWSRKLAEEVRYKSLFFKTLKSDIALDV